MAKLEDIGKPSSEVLNQQLDNCNQILQEFSEQLIRDSKAKLLKDKRRETELSISITPTFNVTAFKFGKPLTLKISMNDYWKFVDKGVDGREKGSFGSPYKFKKKNIKAGVIEKWLGTNPAAQAKFGRDTPRATLAFIIGRKVAREGIKPNHFWSSTLNDGRIEKLNRDMSICFARDIEVILDKKYK